MVGLMAEYRNNNAGDPGGFSRVCMRISPSVNRVIIPVGEDTYQGIIIIPVGEDIGQGINREIIPAGEDTGQG